jgi:thioredoxin-related protein
MLNKLQAYTVLGALCIALASAAGTNAQAAGAPPEIQVPAWFKISFLDLPEDIREAVTAKKRVMIYFGQNGCPYCKQLMIVNFTQADIVAKLRRNFDLIEINILGSREVGWVDGVTRTEKDFARFLKISYTPTLLVIDERGGILLRISGYYPPAPFNATLDYVVDGVFHREPDLQRYLKNRGVPLPERGSRSDAIAR